MGAIGMKNMAPAGMLFCALLLPSSLAAEGFDLRLSYGRWSLSPFTSLVERESENLIKRELTRLVDSVLPQDVFSTFEDIDLSSSGQMVSCSLWYRFDQFSLGIKGDYFEFTMPFSLSAEQSLTFLDIELADVRTEGRGEVRLSALMVSLLARWEVLSLPRFSLFVQGGLSAMPYAGEVSLDQHTVIKTPLGDLEYSGDLSETIDNIRSWDEDIPSVLWAPVFGISGRYAVYRGLGMFLDLGFSQGTVVAAGLSFRL